MSPVRSLVVLAVCLLAWTVSPVRADGDPGREAGSRTRNEGYALLYELLSGLRDTDKILYVKRESDPVEGFVTRLASSADRIASRLETLAARDPGLRLDETGLPEVEVRSREAIRTTQLEAMAPLLGESGVAFERRLLLGHFKALDQLRHMAPILLELETVDERRALLRDAGREFERVFADVSRLLERRYFCGPAEP